MEIPKNLKTLYKHWETHTMQPPVTSASELPEELIWFVSERMKIWEKKQNGELPPYTKDAILQKYRFCNIYRELDRQTINIHTHLKNLEKDFPLWLLNLAFHRFICKPTTVKKVGLLTFSSENNEKVYRNLVNLPKPKYGTPYVFPISVIQKSKYPTREEFFCLYLPKIIPIVSEKIKRFDNLTVNKALEMILPSFGFNFRFHWTEILIDIAYQQPKLINLYKDFYIGPGAKPTALRLNPEELPSNTVDQCVGTRIPSDYLLTYNDNPILLSAENWEGIFCEYRKYTNLKTGSGRKRIYRHDIKLN